jgi:hypothetical protein
MPASKLHLSWNQSSVHSEFFNGIISRLSVLNFNQTDQEIREDQVEI